MIDPVSDIVVTTAASIFLERVSDRTYNWILKKYDGHPKRAIETALRRADRFYEQFAICIEELKNIDGIEEKKEKALADPSYTSIVQEAALGATLTDSTEAQKILAHLVTDRLTAEPDSLRTLSAHMACSAIPHLSPLHLRFLGLMAVIYVLDTPAHLVATREDTGHASYDATIKKGLEWLSEELTPLLPIGDMTVYDYAHLASVSCIAYGHAHRDLLDVMIWKFSTKGGSRRCIEQTEIGKILYQYWNQDMVSEASLTPAGALIGTYAHDAVTSDRRKWAL